MKDSLANAPRLQSHWKACTVHYKMLFIRRQTLSQVSGDRVPSSLLACPHQGNFSLFLYFKQLEKVISAFIFVLLAMGSSLSLTLEAPYCCLQEPAQERMPTWGEISLTRFSQAGGRLPGT